MTSIFKQKGRSRWQYKVRLANGRWETRVGFTDKRATEERAASDQRAIDRSEVGLVDPFAATRKETLSKLADTYGKALRARSRAERYVSGALERLRLLFKATGAQHVDDLDAAAVETFLGRLVRGELPPGRPRSRLGTPVPRRAVSMFTRDRYVESIRAFGAWLHASDRWGSNPWSKLRKEARESDRTMQHRALSEQELQLLVAAAESRCVQRWVGGGARGGGHPGGDQAAVAKVERDGWMRGSLYLFAAYTGLRLNECRQLRRSDLVLDGDEPHVVVRAAVAKNRTEQRVPLVLPVVERLRRHLQRQSESAVRGASRLLDASTHVFEVRRGLLEALRKDAIHADLGLTDAAGRRVTFHGFRSSTATLLARAGVSMPIAMRVLRHSDANLTAKVYAKLGMADMHRELREKLLPPALPNAAELRAAVGHSAPLAATGSTSAGQAEGALAPGLVPLASAPCQSVPLGAGSGEMVGVAGVEPATLSLSS